jgi:heme a synthase
MAEPKNNVWLNRFAWATAVATLFLLALGGMVTTKGVGMAVPDWPTTYGDHLFLFPPSKWMAGIFYEHSHRLWASLVGLFAAVFAIWVWLRDARGTSRNVVVGGILLAVAAMGLRQKPLLFVGLGIVCLAVMIYAIVQAVRQSDRLPWLALILISSVIVQGVLGGLRVILDEHGLGTEFGIFHALLAQVFFLFVCALVLVTSQWWNTQNLVISDRVGQWPLVLTTVLVFVQIFFGATMRHLHEGLAVPTFPLAYGGLWPATDAAAVTLYNAQRLEAAGEHPITPLHLHVHMLHRYVGVLTWCAIVACAVYVCRRVASGRPLRRVVVAWAVIASVQVVLGILSILSQRKLDVTTAHVAVGALTLMLGGLAVLVNSRCAARRRTANNPLTMPADAAQLNAA